MTAFIKAELYQYLCHFFSPGKYNLGLFNQTKRNECLLKNRNRAKIIIDTCFALILHNVIIKLIYVHKKAFSQLQKLGFVRNLLTH